MQETYEELKKAKSLKEIYQILPASFYERGSLVILVGMILMIDLETIARFMFQCTLLDPLVSHFFDIGYLGLMFTGVMILIKCAGNGWNGVRTYFRQNPAEVFLILFIIWMGICTLLSEYPDIAFEGISFRHTGYKTYLIYGAIYMCAKTIKTNTRSDMIIYSMMMTACTAQNLLLITDYCGYYGVKEGVFFNTNHSAYFMVIGIFSTVGFIVSVRHIANKLLGLCLVAVNIWCMIINDTFGTYLALIGGFAFLFVISTIQFKRVRLDVVAVLVVFITTSVITNSVTGILSRNFQITTEDAKKVSTKAETYEHAGSGRIELWEEAIESIKKYPVFGVGPDLCYDKPHNEFLQYACEIGLLGAFFYVGALICFLIRCLKQLKNRQMNMTIEGTVVFAYVISSMFGVNMYYTAVFYFMYLGMLSSYQKKQSK